MSLRVLQVVPSLAATDGGPSEVALRLSTALADNGTEVDLAFTTAGDGEVEYQRSAERARSPRFHDHSFRRLSNGSFKYSRSLGSWLRANCKSFDIVHVHAVFSYPSISAASAARAAAVPYVIRPAGTLNRWSLRQRALRKSLALKAGIGSILQHSAAIHTTSSAEAADIEERFPGVRTVVIPNGVDERLFDIPRQSSPSILFLGRIHAKKRLDLLLQAFQRTRAQAQGWSLSIAGDGPRDEVEKARALAEGVRNVRFLGWLDFDRKAAILSASSIFVLPSADENFAVAAAEAMAAGVPVIATKNVGILTFLEGRRAGMVVEESADAIARAIDELAFDEQKRNAQSEAARNAASELFRWSKISKTVRQLYDDILNS